LVPRKDQSCLACLGTCEVAVTPAVGSGVLLYQIVAKMCMGRCVNNSKRSDFGLNDFSSGPPPMVDAVQYRPDFMACTLSCDSSYSRH
jgi:hypothetical protein